MASRQVKCGQNSYSLSYELIRPNATKAEQKSPKVVLFLHGWGAKKELMKGAFGEHFTECLQVYVDMPGFGASSEPDTALRTTDYANIIQKFLGELSLSPNIIIAHSFGGKVATLLCGQLNGVSTLALLSTAGILEPKRLSVRVKIALFKFAKMLGFGRFRRLFASSDAKDMSQNMYETFKNVVNEDFAPYFSKLNLDKVLIFWGQDDTAVSTNAAKELVLLIKNSSLEILSGDHFFFLSHAKAISQKCLLKD